ncbi:hypothetical protein E3U43_009092, partial [Larimichthys crocea]
GSVLFGSARFCLGRLGSVWVGSVWVGSVTTARCLSVMGLQDFWKRYKVLIVMGTSLGLIHWGWYNLKGNPLLHKDKEEYIPEPGIVAYVSRPPPAAAKSK